MNERIRFGWDWYSIRSIWAQSNESNWILVVALNCWQTRRLIDLSIRIFGFHSVALVVVLGRKCDSTRTFLGHEMFP